MTVSSPHPGGLPFPPLYGSKRSRHLPETPEWLVRAALTASATVAPGWTAWADVVVDYRLVSMREDLPATFDSPGVRHLVWESQIPGWELEGWYWETRRFDLEGHSELGVRDSTTVARFTAPDGFRFAFVVSQDREASRKGNGPSTRFARGRLAFLLPALQHTFTLTHMGPDAPGQPLGHPRPDRGELAYSLDGLRAAVQDPDAWFGEALPSWRTASIETPSGLLDPTRVLLGWAPSGAAHFDVTVQAFVEAGLDGPEAHAWRAMGEPTEPAPGDRDEQGYLIPVAPEAGESVWADADICEWHRVFGGGRKRREVAARFRLTRLPAEQAACWEPVMAGYPTPSMVTAVASFTAAGWEPSDVTAVLVELRRQEDRNDSPWHWAQMTDAVSTAAMWAFAQADMVPLYLRAGLSLDEVRGLLSAGTPPDRETLEVMGALRPVVEPQDPYF